jgi:hypothetical protein
MRTLMLQRSNINDMIDYTAINRLRLKDVFSDNSVVASITCDEDYLTLLFEHSARNHIFVHDDPEVGHAIYVADTSSLGSNRIFIANNPSREDVFLLHIDGVLYNHSSKCDCALLTKNDLFFIELKSNANNRTIISLSSNYQMAFNQLLFTVQDFIARFKVEKQDLCSLVNVKAFAVFNKTVPKNSAYQKKLSADFIRATKKVKLIFANETTLEM